MIHDTIRSYMRDMQSILAKYDIINPQIHVKIMQLLQAAIDDDLPVSRLADTYDMLYWFRDRIEPYRVLLSADQIEDLRMIDDLMTKLHTSIRELRFKLHESMGPI